MEEEAVDATAAATEEEEEEEEEDERIVVGVDFLTKYSALVGADNRGERLDVEVAGARTGRKTRVDAVVLVGMFCLVLCFFSAERRPLRCPGAGLDDMRDGGK
jgi:hypothetical protein